VRWLIVAPHPDDEALIASGVITRAVGRGEPVAVVVMTNGDFDCVHDGLAREAESVAGLAELGVAESALYFLGYPDGGLARLGRTPLQRRRRTIEGSCVLGDRTYGAHGLGGGDYHRVRFGAPAPYTRANSVGDLASVLREVQPTDVIVTHPSDTHPDHAATYVLLREALDRVPGTLPRVHRAIVHNGDCWPTGTQPGEPCPPASIAPELPMPPLSGRLAGYEPRERLAVPDSCLSREPAHNPKLRAIAAHRSQTRGTLDSYLFGFARRDEPFFPEAFERQPGTALPPPSFSRRLARAFVRVGILESAIGGYDLEVDPARGEARLLRRSGGEDRTLASWPLPEDLWTAAAEEPFEVRFDPRPEDGPVLEVNLYCREELTGVAVDPRPLSVSPSVRP
jgi:LmbE family N-acetylglucosaminyl deacetylase